MCCVLGATRLLSERSCSGRIDITECLIGTSVVCDVDRGVRVTSLASATVLCCVSLFLDLMLCGNPFRSCRFSAVCVSLMACTEPWKGFHLRAYRLPGYNSAVVSGSSRQPERVQR